MSDGLTATPHGNPSSLYPDEISLAIKPYYLSSSITIVITRLAVMLSWILWLTQYNGFTGVKGVSQEELFLWLPVKDIIVNDP
ncbi:hypothetical protein R6Q59_018215 [Mikania micrantha]